MSSTEFTIGKDGRNSSKVLMPPGGVASDILGTGPISTNPLPTDTQGNDRSEMNTQKRLFGVCEKASVTQAHVRRNPITGEGISSAKDDLIATGEGEKFTKERFVSEKANEQPNTETRAIKTTIRVRNPPGGKSSGIF